MSRASSSRVRSHSNNSSRQQPSGFQTRYKVRGGNSAILDEHEINKGGRHRTKSLLFANSKKAFDESFAPTSVKLKQENFKHHDPNNCVC